MQARKRLKEQLLDSLAEMLGAYGFKLVRNRQAFRKNTADGMASFHLSFIPHAEDFDITADAAIRFDALETLVGEVNNAISEAQKRQTFSMGVELGNLSQGRQKRWTVRSENDVPEVAAAILEAFQSIALPYIDRYSDPQAALEMLSRNDSQGQRNSPFHQARCKRAVALAFLLGEKHLTEQLITQSESFLSEHDEQSVDPESFGRLVGRIREMQRR